MMEKDSIVIRIAKLMITAANQTATADPSAFIAKLIGLVVTSLNCLTTNVFTVSMLCPLVEMVALT